MRTGRGGDLDGGQQDEGEERDDELVLHLGHPAGKEMTA